FSLNCVIRFNQPIRATQLNIHASVGLYIYPDLMAADILAYQATHVPVGADQKQHLELTRDIAQKFNSDYSVDFFPEVEPLIFGEATRVMSLRDGNAKMSKSDPSENSRINLTDDRDLIAKKIRKARTDSEPLPGQMADLADRAEAKNLINIFAALSERKADDICTEYEGKGFADFKRDLADLSVEKLGPITEEMARLMDDTAYVDGVLGEGANNADKIARPILKEVQDIVGFLRP
ncbi:MAG: hypothetical protein P8H03_09075, partial [Emcibacteraceae bacterium]|nr:hypothetical protein [Emcibacteraceae bacterium]